MGVRRFQNKDGTLTAAGLKRRKTLNNAADKAKRFEEKSREDKNRLTKKAEKARTSQMDGEQYKKAIRDMFGSDAKDSEYVEAQAKSLGYKNSRELAMEHLGIGEKGAKVYTTMAKRAANAEAFYSRLSEQFKNTDVTSLSKKDVKKAEKFLKSAHLNSLWNTPYSDNFNDTIKKYQIKKQ